MDGNVAALSHTCQLSPRLSITHSHTHSPDGAAAVVMTLLSFTAAASPLCTVDQLSYPPHHTHTHIHANTTNGVPVLAHLSNLCLIIMVLKLL